MTELISRRPAHTRPLGRAVRIPVVRSYSEQELRCKLAAPITDKNGPEEIGTTAEDYERAIVWYHEHGYLGDSRFVACSTVSRSRKDYGPARIRQELSQKDISHETTEKMMHGCNIDRCILARDQATQECGEPLSIVFPEKVRIQRFLLYRGYLTEDTQDIWRDFVD